MQKIVFWILALIVIVGGLYFYSSTPVEKAVETGAGEDVVVAPQAVPVEGVDVNVTEMVVENVPNAVITYTDAGFVPSSVTIRKGQTVRWVNNSGSKVWPASAIHPAHSTYPQKSASDCLGSSFDACKGLTQGEAWDFTFDLVGEWKFHNHMRSSQTGVVKVTE